jgi:hypothetical protein
MNGRVAVATRSSSGTPTRDARGSASPSTADHARARDCGAAAFPVADRAVSRDRQEFPDDWLSLVRDVHGANCNEIKCTGCTGDRAGAEPGGHDIEDYSTHLQCGQYAYDSAVSHFDTVSHHKLDGYCDTPI